MKAAIDVAAEDERLTDITDGAGQAMTDQQTADEAKQYIALTEIDGVPEASDFPLLPAELGVTAVSSAKSQLPAQPFLKWQVIGGAIKTARPATKAAIEGRRRVSRGRR